MSLTSTKPRCRSRLAATEDRYPPAQYTTVGLVASSSPSPVGQLAHRDGDRARDHAGRGLTRVANVDDLQVGHLRRPLAERLGCQPRCDPDVVLVLEHHLVGLVEVADHPVETDTGEPVLALELMAGLGEQHDVDVGRKHRTGELRVAAVEPDVDGAAQMPLSELLRACARRPARHRGRSHQAPARRSWTSASPTHRADRAALRLRIASYTK